MLSFAARAGLYGVMPSDFTTQTDRYRRELLVHCYRMLGSLHEAEDLVQETYLRAWRSFDDFEGRSSVRTYLYKIATNACLSVLEQRSRRFMPAGRIDGAGEPLWLEPFPDALLPGSAPSAGDDPAAGADVRLAFVAALQVLPPFRRAVLILRDVLCLSAAEVASVLDSSTAAVNSALPRARAQILRADPPAAELREPSGHQRRMLLDRYVAAFQEADLSGLVQLMRADIALEMPPLAAWFQGRTAVTEFLAGRVLSRPGDFLMTPAGANGAPAFLAYHHADDGSYRPHAVHVLTLDRTGIARLAVFLDPSVAGRFARIGG